MVAAGPVWHSAAPPAVTHSHSPHSNPPWNKYMNKKAEILTRRSSQEGLIQPKQQGSFQRKTIKWGAAGTATGCPILILNTAHFWACASAPTYRTVLMCRIFLLSLSHVKVETDRLLRNKFGHCWSTCGWCEQKYSWGPASQVLQASKTKLYGAGKNKFATLWVILSDSLRVISITTLKAAFQCECAKMTASIKQKQYNAFNSSL